jgi:hypothetical protein
MASNCGMTEILRGMACPPKRRSDTLFLVSVTVE